MNELEEIPMTEEEVAWLNSCDPAEPRPMPRTLTTLERVKDIAWRLRQPRTVPMQTCRYWPTLEVHPLMWYVLPALETWPDVGSLSWLCVTIRLDQR